MPKPSSGREPDPMGRVVDRLLAQLPGLRAPPSPPPQFFAHPLEKFASRLGATSSHPR